MTVRGVCIEGLRDGGRENWIDETTIPTSSIQRGMSYTTFSDVPFFQDFVVLYSKPGPLFLCQNRMLEGLKLIYHLSSICHYLGPVSLLAVLLLHPLLSRFGVDPVLLAVHSIVPLRPGIVSMRNAAARPISLDICVSNVGHHLSW